MDEKPNYEKLKIWQDAMELVIRAYTFTRTFPNNEKYGLVDQIRRAAVSIPGNIAEGQGRGSQKDFKRFLLISKGSLQELNTLIQIALRTGYLSEENYHEVRSQMLSLIRRISSLARNLTSSS